MAQLQEPVTAKLSGPFQSNGKGKLPSLFVPCRFEARFKPLRFPNDRLRNVLGWKPPLDFEECLRRTYERRGTPSTATAATPRPAAW